MTENEAVELLPWLANGTLGEDESAAVRGWIERSTAVREEWERFREDWADHAAVPPGDTLVAWVEGTLEPEEAARVDALMAVSTTARDAAAMLREGRPVEPGGARSGSDTVLAFRSRPAATGAVRRWALAAALASAVATSLLWWSVGGGGTAPEPRAVANVAVVELLPSDTRVRGAADVVDLAERDEILLVLVSDHFSAAEGLRAEIVDADGEVRTRLDGLDRSADGTMTLLVARPAGPTPHEVVVTDAAGIEIERFALRLASAY